MDQKEKILSAAESLFLRYGVKSVSMDDLSKKLGISKKTLYRFIENKKDLIYQVVKQHIQQEENTIKEITKKSGDAVEEMMGIAQYVIMILQQMQPSLLYDLKKYYQDSWHLFETLHLSFVESCIRKNIHRGIREGYYRKQIDPEIISKIYVSRSLLVADEQLFPSTLFGKEDLFKEYIIYHIHGIASKKGLERLNQLSKEYIS